MYHKFNRNVALALALALAVLVISCKKSTDETVDLASVLTTAVTNIAYSSASTGGSITSDISNVTEKGVCWSTSPAPSVSDNKLKDESPDAVFTINITGLNEKTTYYVRAYAINAAGTSYGNEVSFSTPCDCPSTVTDINGNVYNTVLIGNQCWMAENLKVSKYNNGDNIETTSSATLDLTNVSSPKYQWGYNGSISDASTYGRLYTWFTATDSRKIAPAGWHIPTDTEWDELINHLGGASVAGGKMKSTGTLWVLPNYGANNSSGFGALPSGNRNLNGQFYDKGYHAAWWSATPNPSNDNGNYRMIHKDEAQIRSWYYGDKKAGFAVRCIKD